METKKFISGLGQTKEITAFLNANLVDFAIINLIRNADGTATFTTITDFHKIENLTLDLAGQKAFELFGQFRSSKNAIACLLKAIETKKPIDDDTFKNQSKITPAKYEQAEKLLKSFGDFYAYLSEAQKADLHTITENWMEGAGIKDSMLESFFINGENGITLKPKQIIKLHDPIYGQHIYSMVFLASPQGMVTCIDDEAVFSLSAESAKTIEIIDEKKAPEEVKTFFMQKFKEYTEECEERKQDKLEKAMKLADAIKLAHKKAEEKAEKDAVSKKALEAKTKASTIEKGIIEKMKMTSKEEVEKVVALIAKKDEMLISAHKRDLNEIVKKAKIALRAKRTTPASTETPVDLGKLNAEVLAEVGAIPANVPTAKPTRQRRGNAPEAPKQPTSIDEIIKEDAQSENPILA